MTILIYINILKLSKGVQSLRQNIGLVKGDARII